jgi:hypothetical protein
LLQDGVVRAIRATGPVRLIADATSLDVGMDQTYFDAITSIAEEAAAKQDPLSQPGFGEELLYDGSKLQRLAFGAGIIGGTDIQPDGTQSVGITVSPNLTVSSLTPSVASDPVSVAGGLQVTGATAVLHSPSCSPVR